MKKWYEFNSMKGTVASANDETSIATAVEDANSIINLDFENKTTINHTKTSKKRFNLFAPFALLRHPFILMLSITSGFFFSAMFATEAILPEDFSKTYVLYPWQTGLCYLGASIGNLTAALVGSHLSYRLLMRSCHLRGGIARVEDRLTANIWIAGFVFSPLGNLIFGWVVEHKLNFWDVIIGFGIQCFGSVQVMTCRFCAWTWSICYCCY
ncbi:hypothetical protein [Parasitella parasitica]|uniref:Major facilitator superfamily (MFS) profile domain-containing protein n=1 Tax=Parasitella parasitica TaxID=35722 RepID=A0A0B7NHR5_9FUNG|nr:hypothetical protein [Parasitella parasitica]